MSTLLNERAVPARGWLRAVVSVGVWLLWRLPLLPLLTGLLLLPFEGPVPGDLETQMNALLRGDRFEFETWTVEALWGKIRQSLFPAQRYMTETQRHDYVSQYLERVGEINRLDREIDLVYTNPEVADPDAATAERRAQLAGLRAEQSAQQDVFEAILQEQSAVVLMDEGFTWPWGLFPPNAIRFTPLPFMLIVSPRERIEAEFQLGLRPGLDAAEQEAIEGRVAGHFDRSTLTTPIGGLAAYPAMLLETSSINWVADVTAHEWAHHYLDLRPLGLAYSESNEARTINETTASIVGREVGARMVGRYYPELLARRAGGAKLHAASSVQAAEAPSAPAFDYRAEMHHTRVVVDRMLAEGQVERAELYMELRRRVFVAQGYSIRKLNQAYFAFYGAYADEPGATGTDPIGPTVWRLRDRSPSLRVFMQRVAGITSLAELRTLLDEGEVN